MSSSTKALCLLLAVIVAFAYLGAASATVTNNKNNKNNKNNNNNNKNNKIWTKRTLRGSCLMAASTLCADAETDAMRCLRKLAIEGDARVPAACAAIWAGMTANPRRKQGTRANRMFRMLTEATCAGGNTCPSSFVRVNNICNDVLSGCSGCPHGTHTLTTGTSLHAILLNEPNPNGINCANICCKADNGNVASCHSSSYSGPGTVLANVYCATTKD